MSVNAAKNDWAGGEQVQAADLNDAVDQLNEAFARGQIDSLVAGVAISSAGLPLSLSDGQDAVLEDNYNGTEDAASIITTTNWFAQTFQTTADATAIKKISIKGLRGGSATASIRVSIRAVSANVPTGADIESKTVDVLCSTFPTGSYDFVDFEFPEAVAVSPSTTYAIVVRATGATSVNMFWIYDNTTPSYANGNFASSTDSGSSWSSNTAQDHAFRVYESQTDAGKVYPSDASEDDFYANNFIGFSDEAVSADEAVRINHSGIDDNQSGLTVGKTYYLSDTSGAISTTPGSVSKAVCLALSATQVLIKHDN